jgi:hypothetical protein
MHIDHKKPLSVFPQFSNFPGNFSSFSLHTDYYEHLKEKLAKSFLNHP